MRRTLLLILSVILKKIYFFLTLHEVDMQAAGCAAVDAENVNKVDKI